MAIQKVLFNKSGYTLYVSDVNQNFNTPFGYIKSKELKKESRIVKTNTGEEFYIFKAGFIDKFKKLKRNAQIVTLKDIGVIIANTGINKESKIVDAGGGSGALACALANISKQVTTYEIRKDFTKLIEQNIKNLELTNIKVKNKDISKGIAEKNIDLIVLDLPDPHKIVKHAEKSLKHGGFLISYVPSITQVIAFVKEIKKHKNLYYLKTIETIERSWKIDGRIARPEFKMLGHTGFLTFIRKL